MSWLLPGFLSGIFLIGLPILLHLLRNRPKQVVRFPSLHLLGESAIRDTRQHRLRRWLTLLLRCLVIALLAAAFARPFWIRGDAASRSAMIVAIDNSMSMQAGNRWETQKSWALQQLSELKEGDEAALLLMNPFPTWLVPMSDDLPAVRVALQNLEAGFEGTFYANSLRVAGETLATLPAGKKTLVWMADEQRLGWLGADFEEPLPPGVKIRFMEIAPAVNEQAELVSLKKLQGDREGVQATVRLFGSGKSQRSLRVSAGSRDLAEQNVVLTPGDNLIEVPLAWSTDLEWIRVSLNPGDDLAADDTAWMIVAQKSAGDVFVDKFPSPDFLRHALEASQKLENGSLKSLLLPDGEWPKESLVIARNAATFKSPAVEKLDRFLQGGGLLWIFADGSKEQTAWLKQQGIEITELQEREQAWNLQNWETQHPVFAAYEGQSLLPLLEVEFRKGFNLKGEKLETLANWPDGSIAIAEWRSGQQRFLIAGFPLTREATDWPTRPSFVPFIHRAASALVASREARLELRVGDVMTLPQIGNWRLLDGVSDRSAEVKATEVSGSVRVDAPGIYEFSARNTRKLYAVNVLTDESDLQPWPFPEQLAALQNKEEKPEVAEGNNTARPVSDRVAENQQRLWWWLLVACALAMLAELTVANRTTLR
jgi:hypothetical protein